MKDRIERAIKGGLPLLLLANFALLRAELFAAQTAVPITLALEGLLLAVGCRQLLVATRRFRRAHTGGLPIHRALEEGLATLLPRRVARLIALEGRIWGALARWLCRRRPLNTDEFGYARRSPFGTLLALSVITAPFEILAAELLIPWGWLRLLVLVIGIYAIVWIAGIAAGVRVYPHQLAGAGLRVRYGLLTEGWFPYSMIEGIAIERRATPHGAEGLHVVPAQQDREGVRYLATAFIGVGGKTDLTIWLREAISLDGLLAPSLPARVVCFAAEQPEEFAAALRRRIAIAREPSDLDALPAVAQSLPRPDQGEVPDQGDAATLPTNGLLRSQRERRGR